MARLFVILGNQLFSPEILKKHNCTDVFMAEDFELSTYQKHHKLKLFLFLCSMREYRDELRKTGINVHYFELTTREEKQNYSKLLKTFINNHRVTKLDLFEIEDKDFETNLISEVKKMEIEYHIHQSPMFMFTREEFSNFHKNSKTFRMNSFYIYGRKKFSVLVDKDQNPIGGKWSFDTENRKKIPSNITIPSMSDFPKSVYQDEICNLIEEHFSDHPGFLKEVWFPVRRVDAEIQFQCFLRERFMNFGEYEDAMVEEKNFLFHSCISAMLNIGLLSPDYVIRETVKFAEENYIPINSLEGFIRQVMGWREFMRGVYQEKGTYQVKQNYWNHQRDLSKNWYDGTTGIVPLDDSIKKALRQGYNHHIPRLMVISNIMNMCEIKPDVIYKWFMEMYIDSSDWVMVPNVFGMATYADGGLLSTKPYTCGSNYILKMSNYKRGDWCDTVDGLYWRFTEKNIQFFKSNPRLSFLKRTLERMSPDRKNHIYNKAEEFIERVTF